VIEPTRGIAAQQCAAQEIEDQEHVAPEPAAQPCADFASLPIHPIDKTGIVGHAEQIQAQILSLIHRQHLSIGEPLPGEIELGRVFGVNRTVARKALVQLERIGYAVRFKGRGTFVAQPKIVKEIGGSIGFTSSMEAIGVRAGAVVLTAERRQASSEVANRLGVFRGTAVFHLRRLRTADGRPVAIEDSYVELHRFPGIQKIDFNDNSLYKVLAEQYGVFPSRSDELVEAENAGRPEARLLEVGARASLLIATRTVWGKDGKPLEMVRSIYRGDRFQILLGSKPVAMVDEVKSAPDPELTAAPVFQRAARRR